MADAYLQIAEIVLKRVGHPLHVRNILHEAEEHQLLSKQLKGKTQHKTLAARLSEDVRKLGPESKFIRTGPNIFFLKEFGNKGHKTFFAKRRAKSLYRENVLTIDNQFLKEHKYQGILSEPDSLVDNADRFGAFNWMDRRAAEDCYDVKQAISYVLIYHNHSILSYVRGRFSRSEKNLYGCRSVGFGGHVTQDDYDFFSKEDYGITLNAKRELCEELFFTDTEKENLEKKSSLNMCLTINTDSTDEARKHIAFVFIYKATDEFKAVKNELSINDPVWLEIPILKNDLSEFEPWSADLIPLLNSAILTGEK